MGVVDNATEAIVANSIVGLAVCDFFVQKVPFTTFFT